MNGIYPDCIPQELKDLNHWLCWKKIHDSDNPSKYRKEPYQAINPIWKARNNDPQTWCDFKTALFMAENHGMDGIGTVIQSPLILFDFDHCVSDGIIDPDIVEMLDTLNTYSEFSQSKEGIHAIGKARKPGKFGEKIECYDNARFVYITGDLIPGYPTTINECQEAVDTLYARLKPKTVKRPYITISSRTGSISDNFGLRIEDIAFPAGKVIQTQPGRYQGSNPWHGSTRGDNYVIDIPGNWWHCFRNGHDSGGGALTAFAISEGIISCEDARPGCLDGKWREVFEALERRGHKDRTKPYAGKSVVIS